MNVYNVNIPYHHGRLRETLVEAALATARAEGPDAVVLRGATRAAGVTPSAAYRHFSDRDELLAAVSERCMDHLADLIEVRLAEIPPDLGPVAAAWAALRGAGHAYVEFALTEPGWFRTAFDRPVPEGPGGLEPTAGAAPLRS